MISLLLTGLCLSALAAPYIDNIYQPPGDLIDIGSYRLHINCVGDKKPVVILDSGLGGFSLDWVRVQALLQDDVMVCAYDRAGYGWSDQGPSPRVTEQIVEELDSLLKEKHLEPPYILVGHSFGGYTVQYFSKEYPRKIAGIVLIESSHPEQADRMPDIPAVRERSRQARMISMFDPGFLKMYPEEYQPQVMRVFSSDKFHFARQREYLNFTQSGVQVAQIRRLLHVPLAVITRGKRSYDKTPYGEEQERTWRNLQKELLQLSSESWQIIANKSGHLVHFQQPELVADTILSVLHRYCNTHENEGKHDDQSYCR